MLLVVRPPYPFFPAAPGLLVFSVCLDGSIQYAFFSVPFYRLLGEGFPPPKTCPTAPAQFFRFFQSLYPCTPCTGS